MNINIKYKYPIDCLMKALHTYSNMLTILLTGTPGEKKLFLKLKRKTNPYSFLSGIPHAIGATFAIVDTSSLMIVSIKLILNFL